MYDNFSYLFYTLVFCLPPLGFLWWKKWDLLKTQKKALMMMTSFGIIFQLVADPFAEAWHAWFFSPDKILGIWIFNFPIENVLFFILVPLTIATFVIVCIDWKRRGRHSWLVGS